MGIFCSAAKMAVFAAAFLQAGVALAGDAEAVPGEYLIKIKKSTSMQNPSNLARQLNVQLKSTIPQDRILVVRRPLIERADSVIQALSRNPLVETVEPNFIYRVEKTPNDTDFGKLWGLKNNGQNEGENGTAGVDIDAEKAWDLNTGSDDVLVAVVDTGVDYTHPDLQANIWTNEAEAQGQPGVDDDQNGYIDDIHGYNFVDAANPKADPMDDHGHGSHCSGTIGGRGDDGHGIVGVNWHVKILAAKFLGADGGGTLEGAIRAIDYATQMKAKILSNSWGGGGESQLLKEAIQRADAAGALFVAAAGNDGSSNDSMPHYPSSYDVPNVLAVAAVESQGQLASFSNFGRKSVHVAAPGVRVYSSINGGNYASWSGTSMATPHVSGVAGLLLAADPKMTAADLKQRILTTAKPMASLRGKVSTGGLLNAYFALANQVAPPDMDDPATWASQPLSISSAHPYEKNTNQSFEISVSGAKEIALYFEKFDTEYGYDKVSLYDRQGQRLAQLSGLMDDSYSPTIAGDYVKVVFTSDDSVEKTGFDIIKASYR